MGLAEAVSEGYYNSTDEFVRLDIYETLESASFEDVIEEMKDYIDDIVDVILNKEELLEELLETLNISLDNKRESNKTYSVRELNRKNLYTKDQLRRLKKFQDKYINVYPIHYEYWNENIHQYETVYEIRGISNTIRENYETVDEILSHY